MRTAPARLLLGATLLVAGFGVITGGSPLRNDLVQGAFGLVDMKERQCRKAPSAVGSVCPKGCEARPSRSPSDRLVPTECHSPMWLATCGDACDADEGYIRLEDGGLADALRLRLVLEQAADDDMRKKLAAYGVTLEARFDGLYHYDAVISPDAGTSLEKTKKRLEALSSVRFVDYVLK
ncbi:MAG: hypothetical protein QY323_05040 [Patescibacteria group bacterium]|nr:MAG: hypothetical protein QY323_05040 [Patescibacteria group bacterium]